MAAERAYLVECGACGFLGSPELGHCAKCGYDGINPASDGAEWIKAAPVEEIRDELRELVERFTPRLPTAERSDRAEGVLRTRAGIADQLDEALASEPREEKT